MRIIICKIVSVYILILIKYAYCIRNIAVDLSIERASQLYKISTSSKGFRFKKLFLLEPDCKVYSIVYGDRTVWRRKRLLNHMYSEVAVYFVRDTNKLVLFKLAQKGVLSPKNRQFINVRGRWYEIKHKQFNKFKNFLENGTYDESKVNFDKPYHITVDVTHLQETDDIKFNSHFQKRMLTHEFKLKNKNKKVTKVVEGNNVIWYDPFGCTNHIFYVTTFIDLSLIFVTFDVSTPIYNYKVHYQKFGDNWKPVNIRYFSATMRNISRSRLPEPFTPEDISNDFEFFPTDENGTSDPYLDPEVEIIQVENVIVPQDDLILERGRPQDARDANIYEQQPRVNSNSYEDVNNVVTQQPGTSESRSSNVIVEEPIYEEINIPRTPVQQNISSDDIRPPISSDDTRPTSKDTSESSMLYPDTEQSSHVSVENISIGPSSTGNKCCTVDVSRIVESDGIVIKSTTCGDAIRYDYKPTSGHCIDIVTDGKKRLLWSGYGEKVCNNVTSVILGGNILLLGISVQGENDNDFEYHCQLDGYWLPMVPFMARGLYGKLRNGKNIVLDIRDYHRLIRDHMAREENRALAILMSRDSPDRRRLTQSSASYTDSLTDLDITSGIFEPRPNLYKKKDGPRRPYPRIDFRKRSSTPSLKKDDVDDKNVSSTHFKPWNETDDLVSKQKLEGAGGAEAAAIIDLRESEGQRVVIAGEYGNYDNKSDQGAGDVSSFKLEGTGGGDVTSGMKMDHVMYDNLPGAKDVVDWTSSGPEADLREAEGEVIRGPPRRVERPQVDTSLQDGPKVGDENKGVLGGIGGGGKRDAIYIGDENDDINIFGVIGREGLMASATTEGSVSPSTTPPQPPPMHPSTLRQPTMDLGAKPKDMSKMKKKMKKRKKLSGRVDDSSDEDDDEKKDKEPPISVALDILETLSENLYSVDVENDGELVIYKFIPRERYKFFKILEGSTIIWNSSNPKNFCSFVCMYYNPIKDFQVIEICTGSGSTFMEKRGKKWRSISEKKFNTIIGDKE